ncbi:hypothetical protein LSAT2_014968 [Lamellibrachia satsuma]|nr:hypothetical protein LSAT2_014968 [Lamellibrachia satsuma]
MTRRGVGRVVYRTALIALTSWAHRSAGDEQTLREWDVMIDTLASGCHATSKPVLGMRCVSAGSLNYNSAGVHLYSRPSPAILAVRTADSSTQV